MLIRLLCCLLVSALSLSAQTLPTVVVTKNTTPTPGSILIAPNSRVANPPFAPSIIILGNNGVVSRSRFIPEYGFDFRPLPDGRLGYSVFQAAGSGPRASSSIYIVDSTLNSLDSIVSAPNSYNLAMHTFMVLPNGNTILVAQEDVTVDMSKIVPGGHPAATVQQMLLQEVDPHGKIIFQWRSLDHIPITASYDNLTAPSIRYFHLNAVDVDTDGHFLISARHSSLVAKIHRTTGEVIWILGGKLNQFAFSADPSITDPPEFSYQHDIRRLPNNNISLFDNGSQRTPQWSRGVEYQLDEVAKTCKLVWQYRHTPDLYAGVQGSMQTLDNGNKLLAWGSAVSNNRTVINEVSSGGDVVFQAELPSMMFPYKAEKIESSFGRRKASVLIDEILPTNTYTYTRGLDTVGLKVTYHTLISFFYNTTTAIRYSTSPRQPKWGERVGSNIVASIAPSFVAKARVTITQEGMVDHGGEFRFHTPTLGLQNPSSLIVYRRDTIDNGFFIPLRTRYNPVTQELVVDTTQVGEFCFGVPRGTSIARLRSPRHIRPTSGQRLLAQQPVLFQSSGQGYTQAYKVEVYKASPSGDILQHSGITEFDKVLVQSNPLQLNDEGLYYWTTQAFWNGTRPAIEESPIVRDSFYMTAPFITIGSPSTQVSWMQDSAYAITWETNVPGAVTIELLRDNQVVHTIVDSVRASAGGFLWKVPVTVEAGVGYDLRIRSRDGNEIVATDQTQDKRITILELLVSVAEEIVRSNVEIMPNPASSSVFVASDRDVSEVQIFAASGERILVERVEGVGTRINVSDLPGGLYLMMVLTSSGPVTKSFVIQR